MYVHIYIYMIPPDKAISSLCSGPRVQSNDAHATPAKSTVAAADIQQTSPETNTALNLLFGTLVEARVGLGCLLDNLDFEQARNQGSLVLLGRRVLSTVACLRGGEKHPFQEVLEIQYSPGDCSSSKIQATVALDQSLPIKKSQNATLPAPLEPTSTPT